MVDKSVKLSSKYIKPVESINQASESKSLVRNLEICGNKANKHAKNVSTSVNVKDYLEGEFTCRQFKGGDLVEDLSEISDAEVTGYLSTKKEFILKKIAWEFMNPGYQKGKQRKVSTGKKKEPSNKIAKTSATRTLSNAENEYKKRPSLEINYDVLDKLFDADNSLKRGKLEKAVNAGDQMEYLKQNSGESRKQRYSKEDAYREDEECYVDEGFMW